MLPDGERGELVFTSLTKEALPIVRYRTRDLTRLLPGTARTMRRMEKITGRSDDMLIVRGVNLFPTQVEELILRVPGLSPHFQLVLSRPKRLDELTVRVEARTEAASADERLRSEQALAGLIKETIGVTAAGRRARTRSDRAFGGQGAARARPSPGRLLVCLIPVPRYGSIVGR